MNHTTQSRTHWACNKMIELNGAKTLCCECSGHQCQPEAPMVYDSPEKLMMLDVKMAYKHANEKHGEFKNTHEFYGVLMEEVYEVLQAIHANDESATYSEIKDVVATCCKAMIMLRKK